MTRLQSYASSAIAMLCLVHGSATFAQKPTLKPSAGAQKPASAPASTGMTNDDVVALVGAGLQDDIVIAKIRAAHPTSFDTSVSGLKALSRAGVSSGVIRVMIDPSAPVATAPAAVAAAASAPDPDDPGSAHTPGIYMQATAADGKVHLTKLDHITAKSTKSSGAFLSGMTYGIAKAHVKVAIDGPHANIQTVDTNPAFFAYIPEDNNTFGGSALTVKDFTLIKMDPKEKTREVNTATISPWGATSGTDEKARQGFSAETVKPGMYKLVLDRPLPVGQYAFQHQNYGAFFDFGIIPPR